MHKLGSKVLCHEVSVLLCPLILQFPFSRAICHKTENVIFIWAKETRPWWEKEERCKKCLLKKKTKNPQKRCKNQFLTSISSFTSIPFGSLKNVHKMNCLMPKPRCIWYLHSPSCSSTKNSLDWAACTAELFFIARGKPSSATCVRSKCVYFS